MNNQFVHLHLHTNFSLLDGYGSPLSRVKKAKELGMNAIAITDHNILSGCYSFQEACKENDMRCILGVELYYTEDMKMLCIPPEERNGRTKDECKKVMAKKRKEIALETAIANGVDIPKKAKKNEIDNLIKDYEYDTKQFHILFLAKNQIGWNNLVKLQSEAARLCEYNGRNICDDRLIEKYKDGLIMTTACVGGIISNYFLKGEVDKAYEKLDKWHEMFGDDFYIEIQPHSFDKQVICNKYLIQYAIANNIKLISTNDVHYNNKSDHKDHDILVRIGIKTPLSKESKMSYLNEYWVRSYDEMIEAYEQQWLLSMKMNIELAENYNQFLNIVKISLNNTNEIADKISQDIKLKYDKPALPKIKIPNNLSSSDYLSYISYRGLFKYLKNNKTLNMNTYINRLSYELNIINKKGYADYLLIVKEILDWCKENNIPTGPGRGSAGGSLILFVNNMTKCIDPVKYGLLFERFLTMDRTSLPDIDSDLSYLNRGRVIQHLKDKYGENCVSYICNITELGVKNGLKDVGRILDIDFNTMNEITKKIDEISDEDPNTTFKSLDALKEGNDTEKIKYKEFYNLENKYKEIFRLARAFEGTPRNLGVHASGILITPFPINDLFPTKTDDDDSLIVLCDGVTVEKNNGVKIDLLGLKTLDIIDIAIKSYDKNSNIYDMYGYIQDYYADKKMFELLRKKKTEGIFQFGSDLFKGLIDDIQPKDINDISAITSIARPGPLSAGLNKIYSKIKKGELEAYEPLKNTWDIVADSLGVIIYQEHCMRIAQRVAGFDANQADSFLRKAMAKKKKELLALCNQWFIYGKKNEEAPAGYDNDNPNQVFYDPKGKYGKPILGGINNGYALNDLINYIKSIEGFSSYLFNKSHACCYSVLSVCCLYLMTYHIKEFYAAVLSLEDKEDKRNILCSKIREAGINIKIPDINNSTDKFEVVGEDILYGLNQIKGLGAAKLPIILKNKPYASLEDAYNKNIIGKKKYFDKKTGEALIKAGAFDFEDSNRNALLNKFIDIRKAKKDEERYDENSYDEMTCMQYEMEVFGSSISHISKWDNLEAGKSIKTDIYITSIKEKIDKNNNMMAFIEADIKPNKKIQGIIFASVYCRNVDLIKLNTKIPCQIKKDENGKKFIVSKIFREKMISETNYYNVYDNII